MDGIEEECFYHTFDTEDGMVTACLFNPNLGEEGMGVYIKYDTNQLPEIIQWKMMRSREYVCGLNPSTNYGEGRKQALENEEVTFINPLEKREFSVEIGVTEGDVLIKSLFPKI